MRDHRSDSLNPLEPPRAPEAQANSEPGPYEPPALVWEQEFVALATVSPPICEPGSSDQCNP